LIVQQALDLQPLAGIGKDKMVKYKRVTMIDGYTLILPVKTSMEKFYNERRIERLLKTGLVVNRKKILFEDSDAGK